MANHFGRITLVSMFTIPDPSHYQQGETVPCLYWPDRCYLYKHPLLLIMSSIGVSRRMASHTLAGMESQSKKRGGVGSWGAGEGLWLAHWSPKWTEPSQNEANWTTIELLCLPFSASETTIVRSSSRPLFQLSLASPAWTRENIIHAIWGFSLKLLTSLLREHRSWPVRWVPHLHYSISGNIQMHDVFWRLEKCLFLLWKSCSCLLMTDVGPKLC